MNGESKIVLNSCKTAFDLYKGDISINVYYYNSFGTKFHEKILFSIPKDC
jgi:hypothetical protein